MLTKAALNAFIADAKQEAARRLQAQRDFLLPHEFIPKCQIYDSVSEHWISFGLWRSQTEALSALQHHKLIVWLKARQLGATWLTLAYALYKAIHSPIQDILIFSKRETEARYLLSNQRLMGMYQRLSTSVQASAVASTRIEFSNGSVIRGFPSTTGDSYTATLAIVDEADLVPDLDTLLTSVKPTIDAGGQLILLSRANKAKYASPFKKIFRDAMLGKNDYFPIFHGWQVHPDRDQEWYETQLRNAIHVDDVWEQYPSTPEEALAKGSFGKVYPNFSLSDNVSPDADYVPGYPIEWWIDDGFINPLVILMVQQRPWNGYPDHLCIFNEIYITHTDHDEAIKMALTAGYPPPNIAWYDPSAIRLASRLQSARNEGIVETSGQSLYELVPPFVCQINAAYNGIAEGVKAVRHSIGKPDGMRLLQVHPRCENTIREMSNYALTETSAMAGSDPRPVKEDDHTCDAIRYGHTARLLKA